MNYVMGIDLGTSSVKTVLVDERGMVMAEQSEAYPIQSEHAGWSEQAPNVWLKATIAAVRGVMTRSQVTKADVVGLSFSGQMHGLVLLDEQDQVVRNAILWNDTRTSHQCDMIQQRFGDELLAITRNRPLEGFTLPKLLWVQEHEPENFLRARKFLLPKDYVRFELTGEIATDYSDAAGTLLLDVEQKKWSDEILGAFSIPPSLCPPLVESGDIVGILRPKVANAMGLTDRVKVFAGGADNACGAVGAGILSDEYTLCSIGTSGVILSFEERVHNHYNGALHFFNHSSSEAFYSMGVTLAAGYSLSWFKRTFAKDCSYQQLFEEIADVPIGAGELLFTPYLVGERTPYADANVRGSFIGVTDRHTRAHFARAVVEGITFSLRESVEILRSAGKPAHKVISIGGGANNQRWLQMQADVFDAEVTTLSSQQGPALGAAMLAAVGCRWFDSLQDCANAFVGHGRIYYPNKDSGKSYNHLYEVYRAIYPATRQIHHKLASIRM